MAPSRASRANDVTQDCAPSPTGWPQSGPRKSRRRTRSRTRVRRCVLGPRPSYPWRGLASIAICLSRWDCTGRIATCAGAPMTYYRGRTGHRAGGRSSGVEHNLAKVGVVGSNPIARSSARPAPVGMGGDAEPPCVARSPQSGESAVTALVTHRGRLPLRRGALQLRSAGRDRGAGLQLLDLPEERLPPSGGAEVSLHAALGRRPIDQLPLRNRRSGAPFLLGLRHKILLHTALGAGFLTASTRSASIRAR